MILARLLFILALAIAPASAHAIRCEKLLQRLSASDFNTFRTLSDYYGKFAYNSRNSFEIELNERLAKKGGVWLDAGSGDTRAMAEFFSDAKKSAKVRGIAVTFQLKETDVTKALNKLVSEDKIKIFTGKFFEDIPREHFGKVDLITDLFGVFSYAQNLSKVLEAYFEILNRDGKIFIFHAEDYNVVETAKGETITLFEFLKRGKGITVQGTTESSVIVIRKKSNTVTLPKLKLKSIADGAPPRRTYTIVK